MCVFASLTDPGKGPPVLINIGEMARDACYLRLLKLRQSVS